METETVAGCWLFDVHSEQLVEGRMISRGSRVRLIVPRPKGLSDAVFARECASAVSNYRLTNTEVELVILEEPSAAPVYYADRPEVKPMGEALACLLCEPTTNGQFTMSEIDYHLFRGRDLTVIIKHNGAPDQLWTSSVNWLLRSGTARVRVLKLD